VSWVRLARRRHRARQGTTALAAAVAVAAGSGLLFAPAEAAGSERGSDAGVTASEAAALGTEAYLYGYPLAEFERTARIETSVRCPDHLGDAPLNAFSTATRFAKPSSRVVVAPNVDTLYSIAHLDLGRGPVVLSHPAMGKRYFVFELLDPYTDVIGYIGSRSTGPGAGRFAITWSGHRGARVPGARVITSRYRYVWVIGRTLAGDHADQRRALALMRRYTLTPPRGRPSFAPGCHPGKPVSVEPASGLKFLDQLGTELARNPPPDRDRPELARLRRVGVGPGLEPQHAGLSAAALDALVTAVDQEAEQLPTQTREQVLSGAVEHGGWYTPAADTGDYGTDYRYRAEVAAVGLGANTPAEAIYPIALTDSTGHLLDGASTPYALSPAYEITFKPGRLPPARAFWSITMYDESGFLVANPLHRYAIGPDHTALHHEPDGDVVVVLSHVRPAGRYVNWLPAPAGPFRLNLRLYWPRRAALDGRWQPPPIVPVSVGR
jgi:hypothetical protein